ncbi:MAG: type I restriction enzyme HsdR N-terminal domain-containing protein [Nitrospinota bacterium]
MARQAIDKETRRAIREARNMIEQIMRSDANEAETRRRVERIFETVLGYDAFKHLSREQAVRGAGETEHVDFTVKLEEGTDGKPVIMIELKRVGVDLALKHLKQVTSYAIDAGCEWILLTNGREWRVYHVEFGQPPITTLLEQWNLLIDDPSELAQKFELISYRNVRSSGLDDLWRRRKVLEPKNLLSAMLSEPSLRHLRRHLRKTMDVIVGFEEIIQGVRRLLNEASAVEMDNIRIRLPQRKKITRRVSAAEPTEDESDETHEEEEAERPAGE